MRSRDDANSLPCSLSSGFGIVINAVWLVAAQEVLRKMSLEEVNEMPWNHMWPWSQCGALNGALNGAMSGLGAMGAITPLGQYLYQAPGHHPSSGHGQLPSSMPLAGLFPHPLHHLPYPAGLTIAPPHPGSPEPPFRLRSSGNVSPTS